MTKYDPARDHDPLLVVPPQPPRRLGEGRPTRGARSVARAMCPACHPVHAVGVVVQGSHLVWRVHDRVTLAGVRMPCPTSGVTLCVAPAVPLAGLSTPLCTCQ